MFIAFYYYYFFQDEFSKQVQDWNTLRAECVELAMKKMLLPDLIKELRGHLLAEAKECVLKSCCRKLYNWLKVNYHSCKIFVVSFEIFALFLLFVYT